MGKYFKKKVKKKRSKKPFIIAGIIAGVIILIVLIVVIILAIKKSMVPKYEVKTDISIELNSKRPSIEDLFTTYKHMKESMVSVDWSNLDITTNGTYNIPITITIDGEKDDRVIIAVVSDTTPPDLKVNNIIITEGETYKLSDFIISCSDNSLVLCDTNYVSSSFENITQVGTHTIQIEAKDNSNNSIIKDVTLTIKSKEEPKPVDPTPVEPTPVTPTCEFGSMTPNIEEIPYALNVGVLNNNCPIDRKLLLDENGNPDSKGSKLPSSITAKISNIIENEKNKLMKEVKMPNLEKFLAPSMIGISNKEGTGIVAFGIKISLYIDESGKTSGENLIDNKYLKEEYYIKEDGTRSYIKNDYNLK